MFYKFYDLMQCVRFTLDGNRRLVTFFLSKQTEQFCKMKFAALFVFACFSAIALQTEAYISINMDPEDMDRVGDFFQMMMGSQTTNLIQPQRRSGILKTVKSAVFGTVQLFGVTVALVSANILSVYLTPELPMPKSKTSVPATKPQVPAMKPQVSASKSPVHARQTVVHIPITQSKNKLLEECRIDFGCNNNICWRTCRTNSSKKLWCHSAENPLSGQYQRCHTEQECSLCFECIESCHP